MSEHGKIKIFHITDIRNLSGILRSNGLCSDQKLQDLGINHSAIGYSNIKLRRLREIRVPCCRNRYVGCFVPFYFCPRSVMLFTINKGRTGRPPGCQATILHLVSTVDKAFQIPVEWAISDGNAGASATLFASDIASFDTLNWSHLRTGDWTLPEVKHEKQREFLVADFYPWTAIDEVVCHNPAVESEVNQLLQNSQHKPIVRTEARWYY
jgi:hypothetical protein